MGRFHRCRRGMWIREWDSSGQAASFNARKHFHPDFTGIISDYETDIFRPIFDKFGEDEREAVWFRNVADFGG